jgi:hypothetical protein
MQYCLSKLKRLFVEAQVFCRLFIAIHREAEDYDLW